MQTKLFLATAVAAIVALSAVVYAAGCYIDDSNIPCNNAPYKIISCPCPSSTNMCDKTVWFTITTPCTVPGHRDATNTESGYTSLGQSSPQSCNAWGTWPTCDGTPGPAILQKVTCNQSPTDHSSAVCQGGP